MKYAVASEHLDFFKKNGVIEFEKLLNPTQLHSLVDGLQAALSSVLQVSPEKVPQLSSPTLFMAGRDLWRKNEAVRKIALSPILAKIASELIEYKPLRIGYDQFLFWTPKIHHVDRSDQSLTEFLEGRSSLRETCSLQGVACGLMLCLEDAKDKEETSAETGQNSGIYSFQAGNGIYFSPDTILDFGEFCRRQGQSYYLIIYTQKTAVYVLTPRDPNTHALKSVGYVFGDRLSDKLNPIIIR